MSQQRRPWHLGNDIVHRSHTGIPAMSQSFCGERVHILTILSRLGRAARIAVTAASISVTLQTRFVQAAVTFITDHIAKGWPAEVFHYQCFGA